MWLPLLLACTQPTIPPAPGPVVASLQIGEDFQFGGFSARLSLRNPPEEPGDPRPLDSCAESSASIGGGVVEPVPDAWLEVDGDRQDILPSESGVSYSPVVLDELPYGSTIGVGWGANEAPDAVTVPRPVELDPVPTDYSRGDDLLVTWSGESEDGVMFLSVGGKFCRAVDDGEFRIPGDLIDDAVPEVSGTLRNQQYHPAEQGWLRASAFTSQVDQGP